MLPRWEKEEGRDGGQGDQRRLRLEFLFGLDGNLKQTNLYVKEDVDLRILKGAIYRLLRPTHSAWAFNRLRIIKEQGDRT